MVQVMPEQTKCGPSDAAELALSCPVTRQSREALVFVNDERDGVLRLGGELQGRAAVTSDSVGARSRRQCPMRVTAGSPVS